MTLYVSPHLDDVALSCSARILGGRGKGPAPIVATVFSEGNEDAADHYETRRTEDRKACADLGAEPNYCGFPDAPYRSRKYSKFENIIWADLAAEAELIQEVAASLKRIIREKNVAEICAPMGLGWHIDHLVTYEASVLASRETGVPISFYEDRPYALTEGSAAVRLVELGYAESAGVSPQRYIQSLFSMPWMRGFNQKPLEKQFAIDKIQRWWPQTKQGAILAATTEIFASTSFDPSWSVLENFTSQLRHLFPHKKYYSDITAKYSTQINGSKGYVERYWRL